jgi:hypothetical protein
VEDVALDEVLDEAEVLEEELLAVPLDEEELVWPLEEELLAVPLDVELLAVPLDEEVLVWPLDEEVAAVPLDEEVLVCPLDEEVPPVPAEDELGEEPAAPAAPPVEPLSVPPQAGNAATITTETTRPPARRRDAESMGRISIGSTGG